MIRVGNIVLNGICTVGSTPLLEYASQELQKYLLLITGEKVPLYGAVSSPEEIGNHFVLEMKQEGFTSTLYDRSKIFLEKYNLVFRGENPVSVLYAVYDFLKEFCQARFYAPGSAFEEIISSPDLILDEEKFPFEKGSAAAVRDFVNRTNSPEVFSFAVKNRVNTILGCGPWVNGSDQCSIANGELIHSFGLKIRGPGHSWKHFVPEESLYEAHSEYFPLINGKRVPNGRTCCFSNPEARKIFMDNVRKYLKAHPYWDIFAFWAEDIPDMHYCDCEECRKKSTVQWYFLLCNEAAQILHEELPEAVFELIVYRATARPPELPEKFFLDGEKMLIDFCFNYSRDLYHPLAEEINANQELCTLYRSWRSFLQKSSFRGKMMLMEYYNLCEYPNSGPCGRSLLWPMEVMQKDVQFYLHEGFNALGAFTGFDRLAFPTPLRLWMFLQLWSDPELDLESVKKEFYLRYFGKQAFPLLTAYLEIFEKEMFTPASEENLLRLEECVHLLDGLEGERITVLKIHHEYALAVKKLFYYWTQNDRAACEKIKDEWLYFPDRHTELLSRYTAPFPLLWYHYWYGSKMGYDKDGRWIEYTEDMRKMWL